MIYAKNVKHTSVVPKDVEYECLNAYYKGSRWMTPPVCCVCSRRQHGVEIHDVVLNANDDVPDYFSILQVEDGSSFSDEFQFANSGLNGLILDPYGLRINEDHTVLCISHQCNAYLPRSLMPCYALANKLYRVQLPNEFRDLPWIKERVCAKFSAQPQLQCANSYLWLNGSLELGTGALRHYDSLMSSPTSCRSGGTEMACLYCLFVLTTGKDTR